MRNLRRFIRSEGESTALSLSRPVLSLSFSLSFSRSRPSREYTSDHRAIPAPVLRFIVDHVNHRNPRPSPVNGAQIVIRRDSAIPGGSQGEERTRAPSRSTTARARERTRACRRYRSRSAVARKLFGSPCKLITTFKSSNISRRSSPRSVPPHCHATLSPRVAAESGGRGGCRRRGAGRASARGNFRSYKKSYHRRSFFARFFYLPYTGATLLLHRVPLYFPLS
jgi:hypothetical protein